jgi:hypothetical protein
MTAPLGEYREARWHLDQDRHRRGRPPAGLAVLLDRHNMLTYMHAASASAAEATGPGHGPADQGSFGILG